MNTLRNNYIKDRVTLAIDELGELAYRSFNFKNRDFFLPISSKALDRLSVTRPNYLTLKTNYELAVLDIEVFGQDAYERWFDAEDNNELLSMLLKDDNSTMRR